MRALGFRVLVLIVVVIVIVTVVIIRAIMKVLIIVVIIIRVPMDGGQSFCFPPCYQLAPKHILRLHVRKNAGLEGTTDSPRKQIFFESWNPLCPKPKPPCAGLRGPKSEMGFGANRFRAVRLEQFVYGVRSIRAPSL